MSAPENNAPIPGAADYAITLIRQGREEGAAIVEAAHRYTASSEVVRSAVRAKLGILSKTCWSVTGMRRTRRTSTGAHSLPPVRPSPRQKGA